MMLDLDRLRADTPGCARVLHLDNAGSALPPRPVLDAMLDHLRREAEIGGYAAAAEAEPRLEAAYVSIARLIGADPTEIAMMENATRAWDMVFYGLPFRPGDRILTAKAEYASNTISYLQVAQRTGAVVEVVPDDATGQLDVAALEQAVTATDRGPARLIAVSHVPTNGGLVNPAAAIGRIARAHNIPYLLDACQSVGQMPVDVKAIGCDMLSATARKFLRGPRAVGFLYVRRSMLDRIDPPFLDLYAAEMVAPDRYVVRPDARRFENFERNFTGILGMGAAVDYALALGLDTIRDRARALADRLRDGLSTLPGVTVRDKGAERSAIVSFTKADEPAEGLHKRLRAAGINTSVTRRRSTMFDMTDRGLDAMLRASPHCYNSEAEIERFVAAVAAG
ncbi:aminotransferase class V-fold PLP-dependent enzyme [Inquilinus sp. Marseille-Q2685]|uniref:aminotransferase class V-fold PLP-dependent enzyme n=1 Tax=Inquilinus sp. Marseille-Q2685 TaxID=2866581 RepID=UPI001CE45CD4|nr:aminotransferase class V-fold PLP-dependent enzyme [Inquilinus sp. Marseille-Q2685]